MCMFHLWICSLLLFDLFYIVPPLVLLTGDPKRCPWDRSCFPCYGHRRKAWKSCGMKYSIQRKSPQRQQDWLVMQFEVSYQITCWIRIGVSFSKFRLDKFLGKTFIPSCFNICVSLPIFGFQDNIKLVFDNLCQLDHPNIVKFHQYLEMCSWQTKSKLTVPWFSNFKLHVALIWFSVNCIYGFLSLRDVLCYVPIFMNIINFVLFCALR